MKKIAFFTQNLSTGGVQKSVTTLANYLREFYEVTIILAEDDKTTSYILHPSITILKIPTLKVNIRELGVGQVIFHYRVEQLDAILKTLAPDLVISYEDYNNLILLHTLTPCTKAISCRVSLEDSYTPESFIHLLEPSFYFEKIKIYYPQADAVICVSHAIQTELQALTPLSNTTVIYNGITPPKSPTQQVPYKNYILNVGRLHPQKGQKDLINAFNLIKDKISADLVIVGDGVLDEALKELTKTLKLTQRVHFTGFQSPYPYIQQCQLFAFPSYYEGFSNAILEVMSMTKPIIAYHYKGANEILPCNALTPKGDITLLADKLLALIQNDDARRELATQLHTISKEYHTSKTLESFHLQFKQLLQ